MYRPKLLVKPCRGYRTVSGNTLLSHVRSGAPPGMMAAWPAPEVSECHYDVEIKSDPEAASPGAQQRPVSSQRAQPSALGSGR